MEEKFDLAQSLQAINKVMLRPSWFGENAYRAPDAAKPLLYAMACLEVVLENSEKARTLFDQIVEALSKPGIQSVYEKLISHASEEEKEELQKIIKNAPEVYLRKFIEEKGIKQDRLRDILASHVIDAAALEGNDYETFFNLRREALLQRIENATGKKIARETDEAIAEELKQEEYFDIQEDEDVV